MVCLQIATYSTVQNVLKKGDLVMCAQFQAGCSAWLGLAGDKKAFLPDTTPTTLPSHVCHKRSSECDATFGALHATSLRLSLETCSKQEKGDSQLWPPLNKYDRAQGVKTRIVNLVQVNLSGIVNCVTVFYYTMSLNRSQRSQKVREDLLYYLWLTRAKNLDNLYTGKYALWILRRLIKPARWPPGTL